MALTATLSLDIKAFEGGLSKATASLEGFAQKTVKNTNRDLSRMLEEFTGQKVVAESARMAEAVERIGGASKLTEAEQRRVNNTVTEAIAKYQLLGQEAPASLIKLRDATAQTEQKTSFLATATGKLVALFSVAAIGRAARDIADYAGKLNDLKDITGATVEELQVLERIAADGGASLDDLARGAVMLSKNLVGGNAGAADAVKTLGLRVNDLIALGPANAFIAIGDAIAKVPDPMQRAALATEIFGRAGADFLPVFAGDMRGVADAALASGTILSGKLVNDVDEAGKAMERLSLSGRSLIANVLGPIAPGIEIVANLLGSALNAGLSAARAGIDGLIASGLRLDLWLAETVGAITEAVAAVPVLGRVFGQTSGDVAFFEERAQHARDALAAFTAEGAQPAAAAVTAAAPVTTQYGESLRQVAAAAERAAVSVGAMQGPSAELLHLESRTLAETGKLTKELEKWVQTNGALVPTIRQVNGALSEQNPLLSTATNQWVQFAGSVKQHTAAGAAGATGFMASVKAAFGQVGLDAQGMSSIFASAFTGGGGILGGFKAVATQGLGALMGMIPGVGPFLQAFSGPIVEGLSKLAAKGKAILSSMFGGPSASEKEGRAEVKAFEESLWETLDATQALEAGGEAWKKTVIAITAAYVKAGRTEEEALQAAEKLWKSSKISAEESRRVIEEIQNVMQGLPSKKTIDIDVNYTTNQPPPPPGAPPKSGGTVGDAAMSARVSAGSASSGLGSIRVPVYIDGRQTAEAIVPHLAGAMRSRGV